MKHQIKEFFEHFDAYKHSEIMKWISVEDRLPEEHEWVYLANIRFQVTTWGMLLDGKFVNPDLSYQQIENITHWMPLPQPPKE